jgi:hypothetical protein
VRTCEGEKARRSEPLELRRVPQVHDTFGGHSSEHRARALVVLHKWTQSVRQH